MTERRYREGEVRRILDLATRSEATKPGGAPADGLTLAEIQSIAGEVGVAPDAVARAAATLDSAPARPRRSWGMPIEVGRTIMLERPLTDAEWDRLVAELRSTFRARGKVAVQGGLREWSNGNLHACIEPAEKGYRLRLNTVKGDATSVNVLAASGIASGAFVFGASILSGGSPDLAGPLLLAIPGTAALLANMLRLPRWAGQRQRQMAHIEATVRRLMAAPGHTDLRSGSGELE